MFDLGFDVYEYRFGSGYPKITITRLFLSRLQPGLRSRATKRVAYDNLFVNSASIVRGKTDIHLVPWQIGVFIATLPDRCSMKHACLSASATNRAYRNNSKVFFPFSTLSLSFFLSSFCSPVAIRRRKNARTRVARERFEIGWTGRKSLNFRIYRENGKDRGDRGDGRKAMGAIGAIEAK